MNKENSLNRFLKKNSISFLALSIDHPLSKFYEQDEEFMKFKKKCSETGTTEESIESITRVKILYLL